MNTTQSRLHDLLAMALMAAIALAPLPLGSNRPAFWALTALVVGAIGLAYSISMLLIGGSLRAPLGRMKLEAALIAVVIGYMIVQVIPLGLSLPLGSGIPDCDCTTISIAPGETVLALIRYATYVALFFLTIQVAANPDRAASMLTSLTFIVLIHALVGLVSLFSLDDTLLGLPKDAYLGSATGTFVNRNSFATFLGIGLSACIASAVEHYGREHGSRSSKRMMLTLLVIFGAIILATILATQSRMGLVASLSGAVVVLVLLLPSRLTWTGRLVVFSVLAASVAALVFTYGQSTLERLGSVDAAADLRLDFYRQVWQLVMVRPWTGFGAGTFELAFPLIHAEPVSVDLLWDQAHNVYLGLFAENGLLVGTLAILVVALVMRRTMRLLGKSPFRPIAAFSIGATVLVAVHSLVDFSLSIHAIACIFAVVLGLGSAGSFLRQRPQSSESPGHADSSDHNPVAASVRARTNTAAANAAKLANLTAPASNTQPENAAESSNVSNPETAGITEGAAAPAPKSPLATQTTSPRRGRSSRTRGRT